jgi:hypothetical protein
MPQTDSVPHRQLLDDLRSSAQNRQNQAYQALIKATDSPVDWGDESIRPTAERLIATEPDVKYRKKYATVWRK